MKYKMPMVAIFALLLLSPAWTAEKNLQLIGDVNIDWKSFDAKFAFRDENTIVAERPFLKGENVMQEANVLQVDGRSIRTLGSADYHGKWLVNGKATREAATHPVPGVVQYVDVKEPLSGQEEWFADAQGHIVRPDTKLFIDNQTGYVSNGVNGLSFRKKDRTVVIAPANEKVYQFHWSDNKVLYEEGQDIKLFNLKDNKNYAYPKVKNDSEEIEYYLVPEHDMLVEKSNVLNEKGTDYKDFSLALLSLEGKRLEDIPIAKKDKHNYEPMSIGCSQRYIVVLMANNEESVLRVYRFR